MSRVSHRDSFPPRVHALDADPYHADWHIASRRVSARRPRRKHNGITTPPGVAGESWAVGRQRKVEDRLVLPGIATAHRDGPAYSFSAIDFLVATQSSNRRTDQLAQASEARNSRACFPAGGAPTFVRDGVHPGLAGGAKVVGWWREERGGCGHRSEGEDEDEEA